MEDNEKNPTAGFFQQVKPVQLLLSIVVYCIGGGVDHYLGGDINWVNLLLGAGFVASMHLAYQFLLLYFDAQQNLLEPVSKLNRIQYLRHLLPLQLGMGFLTAAVVMVVLLLTQKTLILTTIVLLVIYLLSILSLTVPPLRLEYSGYGELIQSVLISVIGPSIGFLLQTGEIHRILAMSVVPLAFLFIALFLALGLKSYARDIHQEKKRFLLRVGWQRGVFIHNLFILLAYVLWGSASLVGFSWKVAFPVLLTLPVGIFQIWQVQKIVSGAKPNWVLLEWNAYGLLFLVTYLINYSLWIV